jgi:hypothetical protein
VALSSSNRSRTLAAVAAASTVLAVDLVDAATSRTQYFHPRSAAVVVLAALLGAALLAYAPRVPSRGVVVGAGLAAGGAFATAVSALAWSPGVPDPIVRGGVAFNLADVALALGDALLVASALLYAWRSRGRLREPV